MLLKDLKRFKKKQDRLWEAILARPQPKEKMKKPAPSMIELGIRIFRSGWRDGKHLQHLNDALEKVIRGKTKRLMIFIPPRHAKTTMACQLLVPCYLSQHPDHRVIYTTYQATRAAEWGGRCRDAVINNADALGIDVQSDGRSSSSWNIQGHRGGMLTAGVGGPIVGTGANLFIIDDPIKNHEEADSGLMREKLREWWDSTAKTRLEPNGAVVMIMHRWRRDDLMGTILQDSIVSGEEWKVISLPALAGEDDVLGRKEGEPLWPERFTLKDMEDRRKTTSPRWWHALYQQEPQVEGEGRFKKSWFENSRYRDINDALIAGAGYFGSDNLVHKTALKTIIIIDPANRKTKSSKNTCIKVASMDAKTRWFIREVVVRKLAVEEIIPELYRLVLKYRPQYAGIEANGFQIGLVNEANDKRKYPQMCPIKELDHEGKSKLTRATPAIVMAKQGQIYVPHDGEAEWLKGWFSELELFTGDDKLDVFTDQVDTLAYTVLESGNQFGASAAPFAV